MTTEYRTIPLTQGQFATVDAADYEWLSQWKWCAVWNSCTKSFYAVRTIRLGDKITQRRIAMHRQILGLEHRSTLHGDHRNHDTLDNRRENLRACTRSQNQWNQGPPRTNTSGYKGVSWNKKMEKWQAHIRVFSRKKNLGYFRSPEEAYAAYCGAAEACHGEFAKVA